MTEYNKQSEPGTSWYFAIGSMINPISLSLRNLTPIRSYPAQLIGYKIFFSYKGFADIARLSDSAEESPSHGVLHLLTEEDFDQLDKIEIHYSRRFVQAKLYDGTYVDSYAYIIDPAKMGSIQPPDHPTERYLDVIISGCEHYGVNIDYITWLREHPCYARVPPEQFATIKDIPEGVYFTFDELHAMDGSSGKGLALSIDHVVMKSIAADDSHPSVYTFTRLGYIARDCTVAMARVSYDPKFPVAETYERMSAEHRASVVNYFVNFYNTAGMWVPVGRLVADAD